MRGDRININNRSLLYACYRQFTLWIHKRLGKVPSSAIWEIRNHYPELDGQYAPFQEAKDEINA